MQLIALRDPVVEELGRLGFGRIRSVSDATPAWRSDNGGGVQLLRYDTQEGPVLCKQDAAAPDESAFAAESASLKALRAASMSTGGLMLRVPRPLGVGALPLGGSFLLLEWVEGEAPAGPIALGRLGAGLAALTARRRRARTVTDFAPTRGWAAAAAAAAAGQPVGRYLSILRRAAARPQPRRRRRVTALARTRVRAQFAAILRRNSSAQFLHIDAILPAAGPSSAAPTRCSPANGAPPAPSTAR